MTVLDLQTFSASTLSDSEALPAALRALESCLAGPDIPLDLIVQDLCSIPNLFEFIVSAFPSAEGLVRRILDTYPTDPTLVGASSATILLRRLSSVMFALPTDLFPTETIRHIGRHKVYVEDALLVLPLLCFTEFSTCTTTDATPTSILEDPEYDNEEFSGFFVRGKKQKKPRRKNKNDSQTINTTPFHKLGIKVPLDNAEAFQMARKITDDLKTILKFYLELLLEPSLAQRLKGAYISTGNNTTVRLSTPQETNVIVSSEPKPSAYPKVQPMKAALYFENADGFGDWCIIIGTDATKKLRELANGDREKCVIVVKKIKQLSKGRFSDENQKRLNGPSGVPIFEAKMQQDLRLVYQVDVVPDYDGEHERQVIKIYGIYSRTQFDRNWDAVGQHLSGKGKEYCRRCIFRNRPVHAGSDVCLPAYFPPESLQTNTESTMPVLSDEDKEELHSLLVLEKYVTFSQAFLHSLIVNQDVQHVFELTPQEREIVECRSSCYVLGRSGTGKTTTMLFKMLGIQRAWEMQMSGLPKPRQIFVTKSPVLATKVEEYFMKLLESLVLAGYTLEDLKRMRVRSTESELPITGNEDQVHIPRRYSALEEKHFPLFVTFDKLARMIATDVLAGDGPEVRRVARFFIDTDEIEAQDLFVTYDIFARTYWPHFPQPLTKGLDPWLVFSEFMGVIKGSEKSLLYPDGFLNEEAYCTLSVRSNPIFANQRRTVYAIFEAYCKLKKERRHHDVADRTHAILRTLRGGTPLRGQKVDYLYVDEAQDNLLIDALLLRLICRNPEGLFWAGDTAQTISAGSSFRFDDLKAFLYRIEKDQSTHLIQDRAFINPSAFQLAINYRSHGGIVNCAHTVIERITHFWPDAIDGLQREHGIIDGLKPVFFSGWDQGTVEFKQFFLRGESGSPIEFGAQQCIIVRDSEAAEKLHDEVGDIGLIVTLYDSKGLEFNDVLLYNFFEGSAVDVLRWHVLLNQAEGEVDGQDLAKVHAPSFGRDEGRFAGVCSELKLLYVGITRARKNLWIFDGSDKSEPMRMIWTSRGQIKNWTPGMVVPRLAVSSTSAEWESSGRDLLRHNKYPQAMHCFTKASLPRMVAVCGAFQLREGARTKVGVAAQQEAFFTAADAFTVSGNDAPAGKERFVYYRCAAGCYVRAGDHRKAAIRYLSAREYELAAQQFRKAGLFDETLEIIHKHSKDIPQESLEELYIVCRLYYCNKRDGNRPRFPLFPSFEEELVFLENYDLDFARAALLETHGRYLEAAELHLSENRPLDAIRDFLKEKESRDAIQRATEVLLDGLWRRCSFGIASEEVAADRDVSELLNLTHELPIEFLDPLDHDEISMFRAIARGDLISLEKLSHDFIKGQRKAAALLALDHFFSRFPVLKSYSLSEMSLFLDKFYQYARLLHQIISHADPLSTDSIRRLFCITEISSTEYRMEIGSFLHRSATGDSQGPVYLRPSVVTLSKREMVTALRKYLAEHLCERVTEENDSCHGAVVFSQCLTFIVYGQCKRADCPQEHVRSADLDSKRYNVRIGIHLQQICILQLMYSVNSHLPRRICVLDWLTYLYEAFNPQSHIQGSLADLDLSLIPGSHGSIGVMKHWVQDAFYTLRAYHDRSAFLTTVLKLTSLLFTFDKPSAFKCIRQAPFNAHHARVQEFMHPGGGYVLEDIVSLFDGTQQTCIAAGLSFLKLVLKSSLPVDLSVFCNCLEVVVAKISVSWRLSFDPPLDGLVLPRGWLSPSRDFSRKKEICAALIVDVLDCVRDLLMCLQSDTTSRTYTLSDTRLTPMLCNVFTARICRALCLLTYNAQRNAPNFALGNIVRNKVRGIFDALQTVRPMQRAHPLYRKYVQARDDEYLRVMVEYDAGAKVIIEDLVQLLHRRRGSLRAPLLELPRIEIIYFANPSEIPSLLASQLVAACSDLRVDVPAFVPRGGHISHVKRAEDEEKVQPEKPVDEPIDEVHEEPQELAPAPNKPALIREHEPTEDEVNAAKKIKATYRTYRNHREAQARAIGRGLKAQRNTIFLACLKNVYALGWGRTPYRTLYLWALPRLVVCLDRAIAVTHEFKDKMKGQLLKASHERLEVLGKRMSRITALLKDGHQLRKLIEPNADMHREKDEGKMKKAVLDVKDFIYQLQPAQAPEIQEDFRVAYELVMVEKQVFKPEKPTLNTEDV